MTAPSPFFELREVWELSVIENLTVSDRGIHISEGLAAITWAPHTSHLTVWIVGTEQKAFCSSTHKPSRAVDKWGSYGLPPLSHECLLKLSALEAARSEAV